MSIHGISFLKRLIGHPRGTSTLEFALLAPILAFMTVAIVDVAQALSRKFEIAQAGYRALELVTVGSLRSDYSYLRQEAADAAGEPVANVAISNWLECDDARQDDFNGTCPGSQQTARFIELSIISYFKPNFPLGPFGFTFGGSEDGLVRLTARSTIRVQ